MSAVGHYLESEGIATTGISLVREHTEAMRPPRALWVPFMYGRPLGVPDDPAFQREVLRSALSLLERADVPVLEDFGRDAPVDPLSRFDARATGDAAHANEPGDEEAMACPVAFSRLVPAGDSHAALVAALLEEVGQLSPWHDLASRRRGGSTAGIGGQPPVGAAQFVASMLGPSPPEVGPGGAPLVQALKLACDDLRAFYEEAALAQPGRLSSEALGDWYYRQTIAGDVVARLRERLLVSGDEALATLAERMLIPRRWVR